MIEIVLLILMILNVITIKPIIIQVFNIMKEAYVSYKTAKLLKEKGFDEKCHSSYWGSNDNIDYTDFPLNYNDNNSSCSRPTHQMAMAWLREVYNIFIEIIIFRENMVHYRFKILNRDCEKIYIDDGSQFNYEDAVEAALKYTLENLI